MERRYDPETIRQLETFCREIGSVLKQTCVAPDGEKYGFMLMIFSFDGAEMSYISNAQRKDMITAMEEFTQKLRNVEPGLQSQRN